MRNTLRSTALGILGVLMLSPMAVHAGKCSGVNVNNVASWDQTEIAKGTTSATKRATSVTVGDDTGAPHHMVSGECIGNFLTNPDGKTQAMGYCARKDKDGDVLFEEWISTDGTGGKGTWRNTGGAGKFSKAANSGQWEFSPLQGKMSAVRWVGNCN